MEFLALNSTILFPDWSLDSIRDSKSPEQAFSFKYGIPYMGRGGDFEGNLPYVLSRDELGKL